MAMQKAASLEPCFWYQSTPWWLWQQLGSMLSKIATKVLVAFPVVKLDWRSVHTDHKFWIPVPSVPVEQSAPNDKHTKATACLKKKKLSNSQWNQYNRTTSVVQSWINIKMYWCLNYSSLVRVFAWPVLNCIRQTFTDRSELELFFFNHMKEVNNYCNKKEETCFD